MGLKVRLLQRSAVFATGFLQSSPVTTRPFRTALGILIAVDLTFVALHLLWSADASFAPFGQPFSFGADRRFSIGMERGYAEIWEFFKGSFAALLLIGCYLYHRQAAYLGLALLFAYVVGDNLYLFHEKAGIRLAQAFGQGRQSFSRHAGELIALAGMGLAAITVFSLAYRRSDPEARRTALIGLGALILLGAFGGGVDFVHAATASVIDLPKRIDDAFTLIEDGGETISISLGLAFSWAAFRSLQGAEQALQAKSL